MAEELFVLFIIIMVILAYLYTFLWSKILTQQENESEYDFEVRIDTYSIWSAAATFIIPSFLLMLSEIYSYFTSDDTGEYKVYS